MSRRYTIPLGSIGSVIRLPITEIDSAGTEATADLSAIDSATLYTRKPDGVVTSRAGVVGASYIQWTTTAATDLDVGGWWRAWAVLVDGSNSWPTETIEFRVTTPGERP